MLQGTIANTLGAGYLGTVGACMYVTLVLFIWQPAVLTTSQSLLASSIFFSLFGVTVVQAWIYYGNFPNDWAFQKISVCCFPSSRQTPIDPNLWRLQFCCTSWPPVSRRLANANFMTSHRVLDALHLSVTIHSMYHYMIDKFGDVTGLQSVVWWVIWLIKVSDRQI